MFVVFVLFFWRHHVWWIVAMMLLIKVNHDIRLGNQTSDCISLFISNFLLLVGTFSDGTLWSICFPWHPTEALLEAAQLTWSAAVKSSQEFNKPDNVFNSRSTSKQLCKLIRCRLSSGYITKKMVSGLKNQTVSCRVEQSCYFDTEALQMCEYKTHISFHLQDDYHLNPLQNSRMWTKSIKTGAQCSCIFSCKCKLH